MRKAYFLFLIFFFLSSSAYSSCEVIDDVGQRISLKTSAKRIVSLAPDITENLFAIGAADLIVGVIEGSDYPVLAKKMTIVGSFRGLDLERLFSLKPDLIITWGENFSRQLAFFKKRGIAIYVAKPKLLQDVPKLMKNLGCLTGRKITADKKAAAFLNELEMLAKRYQKKESISVFYQLGDFSLMTINKDSWINEVITLCGGKNIFAKANTLAPIVSIEAVIVANPAVILAGERHDEWKKRWLPWSSLEAVKNKNLFTLNPDHLHRAGPRLLKGIESVCLTLNSP